MWVDDKDNLVIAVVKKRSAIRKAFSATTYASLRYLGTYL